MTTGQLEVLSTPSPHSHTHPLEDTLSLPSLWLLVTFMGHWTPERLELGSYVAQEASVLIGS